jgi:outer membrane receptor protein involved in Fe transport
MSNVRKNLLGSGAVIVLVTSLATIASAQEANDGNEVKRFDEIVVTARKRAENIQETPLSISAFTSAVIESAGIRDMADIAKFTPGFTLDDEFGRTSGVRPVIRGQATILGASGVSTFVDGVLLNGSILDYDLTDVERIEVVKGPQSALYGRNTYSGAINIITKSPSDEFTGDVKAEAGRFDRYELSGTVRGPISDTVSASLHGRYFTRGGPFTNEFDGSKVGQQESASLSLAMFYEPSDRLSARARFRISKLHDDQPRLFSTDPEDNNILPDDGGTYLGNGRYFAGEITNRAIRYDDVRQLDEKGFEDTLGIQGSLSIDYELNEQFNLEFINGFDYDNSEAKFDFDHQETSLAPFAVYIGPVFPFAFGPNPSPMSFAHAFVIGDPADFASVGETESDDHSHELRLNYENGDVRAMIGGYYYGESSKFQATRQAPAALEELLTEGFAAQEARMEAQCAVHANDVALRCFQFPPIGFNAIFNFGSELEQLAFSGDRSIIKGDRRNLAIFGSADVDLVENLSLTVEARYKSEKVTSATTTRAAIYDYTGFQTGFTESPEVVRGKTFNSFNPRFTAKYQFSDNTNFYAIAARGDKPGGFNNINATPLGFGTFDEETVWAFEGGMKNTLMDGTLILNLAGFHNTITDYQLTQAATLAGGVTTTVISNVGKVRVQGIEAEMIYRVPTIPGLVINANYALADSEILKGTDLNEGRHLDVADDRRLNCSIGLQDPSQGCSADNTLFGSIVGRQLPRSPKHTFNLGMNFSQSITTDWDINLNANLSHESKKFVQVHNLAFVGSNTLLNGSIGFQSDNGGSITFWGRNLTNEDAVVSAQRFIDPNESFQRVFIGNPRLPREYGVTLRKSF